MFQVLRDGTRTQHSVPLYCTLNVLNVFIWTIFFHPQILRNLHPWIHPCVLACWHLSVIHELQFRFVWVQKWPFDLRVSICSLHLRLWSGSVWINFPMSLCLLGSCVYLSYVTGFGFKQNILSCFSAMPSYTTIQLVPPVSSNKLFHLAPQKNCTKCLNNYLTAPN